jgi:hypothetical protein
MTHDLLHLNWGGRLLPLLPLPQRVDQLDQLDRTQRITVKVRNKAR